MAEYQAFLTALGAFVEQSEMLYNEPMARHTTFRVGGAADVLLKPKTVEALAAALRAANETGTPHTVIGNGSNLLVRDEGYRGVILCTGELRAVHTQGDCMVCEAGALMSQIARAAYGYSLTGLEFAAGIPGTLGGAVFMNAGAYDGEMKNVLTETVYLDARGQEHVLPAAEQALGYRTSIFKAHTDWTIVRASLRLAQGDPAAIRAKMEDFAARRRDKQPLELPSAGSTFKRPVGHFAGKLIEDAGLRGFSVGGAQVSEKHCGFVVNTGGATCADVLALIDVVRDKVQAQSGVTLECEVRLL